MIGVLTALAAFTKAPVDADFLPPLSQTVIYESNLRALGPSGGFRELTDRLDGLKKLGINVLWLMPIMPVGKVKAVPPMGSPYAVADYGKVNPEFGTTEEFSRLVKKAHRRKIAVMLDWVANHTAWDNPWLTAHPDWYTHDASGAITHPPGTNWMDVADLNYDVAPMRLAMIAAMQSWVTKYGVDGFRCDAADYVPLDFWKEAISSLRAKSGKRLLMLGEGGNRGLYGSGFDLLYGWDFYGKLRSIFGGGKASGLSGVASEGLRLGFITNHDESAFHDPYVQVFGGEEGSEAAFLITALYGGVPLVYEGQEVGWPKAIPIFERSSIDWNSGPAVRAWMTRLLDVRRKHEAFQTGTVTDFSTNDVVAFARVGKGETGLVLANVRNRPIEVDIPARWQGQWTDGFSLEPTTLGTSIHLPAFGTKVCIRPRGNGIH
ncbi:MAG: alpha-amylase [Armatimonadetes bacterium]|nr:alpha-amylase [Armatimonadota bacterium]